MKLKGKLLLSFVVLVTIPLIVLGYFSYNDAANALEEEVMQKLQDELKDLQKGIYSKKSDFEVNTNLIANLDDIRNATESDESLKKASQIFDNNRDSLKFYVEDFLLINKDGKVVADGTGGKNLGLDLSKEKYVVSGFKGSSTWSELTTSKASENPVLIYATPVRGSYGKIDTVLAAVVKFDSFSEIVRQVTPGKTGFSFMIDSNGLVIVHPDKETVFKTNLLEIENKELQAIAADMVQGNLNKGFYTYDGSYKLINYASVGTWSVAITIPVEEYMDANT